MSRELTRILADRQNSNCVIKNYDEQGSGGLMIFGFLEDSEESFGSSSSISGDSGSYGHLEDEQEDDVNSFNAEENKAFWESQDQLLKVILWVIVVHVFCIQKLELWSSYYMVSFAGNFV